MRILTLLAILALAPAGFAQAQAQAPTAPAAAPSPPPADTKAAEPAAAVPAPAPLSPAPAPMIRSGTYALTGTAADGTAYEGALDLRATGPQTWRLTWRIDGEVTEGTGITIGNRLVYGYGSDGEVGTGYYEPQMDGRVVGRWTQGPDGGLGTEILLPR